MPKFNLENQQRELEQGALLKLEKVILTLPQEDCNRGGLFEGVQASSFTVLDMPGVEDGEFAEKILKVVREKKSSMLPIFLLNLDAGTAALTEFEKMREIFKDDNQIRIPVIFTKLSFAMKNARNELTNSAAHNAKSVDQQRLDVIKMTQGHIHKLRDDIRVNLPNAHFFIYDPTCNGKGLPIPIKKYWVSQGDDELTIMED